LKQLTSVKNNSRKVNKQNKNGTSNAQWTKLQKLYFKLYGDIYGPPTEVCGRIERGPQNPEDQFSEFDSDSEWENFEYDSNSEWEQIPSSARESEGEEDNGPRDQPDGDPKEAQPKDEQGKNDGPKEEIQEAPDQMAQGASPIQAGTMSYMQRKQLSKLQGLKRPEAKRNSPTNKQTTKTSKPAIPMHRAQKVPTRAPTHSSNPLSPPTLRSQRASVNKGPDSSHAIATSRQGTKDPKVLQMDQPATSKDEKIYQKTNTGATRTTGATRKPTVSTKGLANTILKPNRNFKEVSNDIKLLARIVGLSPNQISKETKVELVGDLINQAAQDAIPVPQMARQRSNPELNVAQQHEGHNRPTTPQLTKQERDQKEDTPNLEQTKRQIKKEQELREEGLLPFAGAVRPTRSNFSAPPIPPLPKNPIERKRQDQKTFKQLTEELEKYKIDKEKREKERVERQKREQLEFERNERRKEREIRQRMEQLD
jgi:hypothetical protein